MAFLRFNVSSQVALAILLASTAPFVAGTAHAKPAKLRDSCAPLRKPFTAIRDYRRNRMLTGVVGGALAGLAAAALVDAINGKKKGVNYGAAAAGGAVAGGLVGWITAKKQAGLKRDELRSAIDSELNQDVAQFSTLPDQIAALGNCRREQMYQLEQDVTAGLYPKEEAAKRLAKIDGWVAEDDRIIAKAANQQSKTITTFAQATAMAEDIDPQTAQQGDYAVSRYRDGTGESALGLRTELVNAAAEASPATRAEPVSRAAPMFVANTGGGNLRAEPVADARIVAALPRGTSVLAEPTGATGWMSVSANGQTGYMRDSLLSTTLSAPKTSAAKGKGGTRVTPTARPESRLESTAGKAGVRRLALSPATHKTPRPQQTVTVAIASRDNTEKVQQRNQALTMEQRQALKERLQI